MILNGLTGAHQLVASRPPGTSLKDFLGLIADLSIGLGRNLCGTRAMFAAGAALDSHWGLYGSCGNSGLCLVYSCLSLKVIVGRQCVINYKGTVCVSVCSLVPAFAFVIDI